MSFFDAAFEIVIGLEGSYSNDPRDPGQETKYGISKRAYPNVDIPQLTLQEAQGIYKRDYWDKLSLDSYAWPRALLLFDAAVNQGANYARNLPFAPIEIAVERALHYAQSRDFALYGRGWLRRLFTVFKQSQVAP